MRAVGLWTWLIFAGLAASARSALLGYYASAFFVVLCASPLSAMAQVIKERNADSIYAPMTVAQVLNCGMWTVYGFFAINDVFVWAPNLVGWLLGLLQLLLKFLFRSQSLQR